MCVNLFGHSFPRRTALNINRSAMSNCVRQTCDSNKVLIDIEKSKAKDKKL